MTESGCRKHEQLHSSSCIISDAGAQAVNIKASAPRKSTPLACCRWTKVTENEAGIGFACFSSVSHIPSDVVSPTRLIAEPGICF